MQPMLETKKSVGMAIGVIEGGRTQVFGFGRTVLGGEKTPDGKSLYEIGSVTKVFTSLALADMAEEGLVRLDDPVQRYLPDDVKVPSRSGRAITLEDLATHSSGLPRLPGNIIVFALKNPQDPYASFKEKDLYDFFKTWKPEHDSGSKFEYSKPWRRVAGPCPRAARGPRLRPAHLDPDLRPPRHERHEGQARR